MASWEETIIFVFAERKSAKFSHRVRGMVLHPFQRHYLESRKKFLVMQ